MLIPKIKKKETIENPFRPKIGIPDKKSKCKLSWGNYHLEYDEIILRVKVDAEDNEEFIAVLEANIPQEEIYRCNDYEVWLVDKKWKKFLVDTAKEYFDEVKTELRTW